MSARPAPPRLGLTIAEAAQAIGISESTFKRHVAPDLRVVRKGSCRIVPVAELEKWLDREASLAAGEYGNPDLQNGGRAAQTAARPAHGGNTP